jgi:DNA-binding transcriptional regulator PaaX
LLDELIVLARGEGPEVAIKDLALRLEERGFAEAQMRRALMSLLRRGQLSLSGGKRVSYRASGGAAQGKIRSR